MLKLPRIIPDKSRMVVTLWGSSNMKRGKSRSSKMQEHQIYAYFHGSKKIWPSQIGMLWKREGVYNRLYNSLNKPVVDKNTKATQKLYVSHKLTQEETVSYIAGVDINVMYLEKRKLASKLFITGWSILNMTKRVYVTTTRWWRIQQRNEIWVQTNQLTVVIPNMMLLNL